MENWNYMYSYMIPLSLIYNIPPDSHMIFTPLLLMNEEVEFVIAVSLFLCLNCLSMFETKQVLVRNLYNKSWYCITLNYFTYFDWWSLNVHSVHPDVP